MAPCRIWGFFSPIKFIKRYLQQSLFLHKINEIDVSKSFVKLSLLDSKAINNNSFTKKIEPVPKNKIPIAKTTPSDSSWSICIKFFNSKVPFFNETDY